MKVKVYVVVRHHKKYRFIEEVCHVFKERKSAEEYIRRECYHSGGNDDYVIVERYL